MNRNEAVTYLKEINNSCKSMSPDAVTLLHSSPNDPNTIGYKIHIKTMLDNENKQQVTNIAKKHNLAVKEEKGEVIIYQPKEVAKTT